MCPEQRLLFLICKIDETLIQQRSVGVTAHDSEMSPAIAKIHLNMAHAFDNG